MLVSQSQIMIKYQSCRKHYTSPAIVVRQIKSEVQGISYYSGIFYTSLTYLFLAGPVDLYNRGKYTLQAKMFAHDSVALKYKTYLARTGASLLRPSKNNCV